MIKEPILQDSIQVEGMTCSGCARTVESIFLKNGYQNVHVNLLDGKVNFQSIPTSRPIDQLSKELLTHGYSIPQLNGHIKSSKSWKINVIVACAIPLLIPHVFMLMGTHLYLGFWIECVLATIIYALTFPKFLKSSWNALQEGILHMDLLITIGASAAYLLSIYLFYLQQTPYYFEAGALILVFVTVGNTLEKKAFQKTTHYLHQLRDNSPSKALQILFNQQILEVEASQLLPDDKILVNAGLQIPVDGIVLQGSASIDESVINGESIPVLKKVGDEVAGGSLCVEGNIQIRVVKIAQESTYALMTQWVEDAMSKKPAIQKYADQISAIFVPVVLVISVLTFLINYYGFHQGIQTCIIRSIAVLVVSCPCAMGIATPAAVAVGVGMMAKKGILSTSAQAIQNLAEANQFYFDKTGTLTLGQLKVSHIEFVESSHSQEEYYSGLKGLVSQSVHPVSKSIYSFIPNDISRKEIQHIQPIPGVGITGVDAFGNTYSLLRSENSALHELNYQLNKKLIAIIQLTDTLRPGVREMIQDLKRTANHVEIFSGDKKEQVATIAQATGIDTFQSEMSAMQKMEQLTLAKKKGTVCMIGDGLNDGPALASADVSIAFRDATDLAQKTSNFILMSGEPKLINTAIRDSKLTIKTIRENLFWAFAYNILAIPLAASGHLSPIFSALFMAISDFVVIGNALRLPFRKARN